MGTSGGQLTEWCKRKQVRGFLGVFCSDNLPKLWAPGDVCLIVNHSPCDSPSGGSHWLACRIRGERADWFDSFGLPPDAPLENELMGSPQDAPPAFREWLASCGVISIKYHDRDIQSVGSEVCGLYACWFCYAGLPRDNRKLWSFLTANKRHNDREIRERVKVKHGIY